MWFRRLTWLLPLLAIGLVATQLVTLADSPGLGNPVVLFLVGVDVAFGFAVAHVFRELRRPEPMTLTTLLLGTVGLTILAALVASVEGGRHLEGAFQLCAVILVIRGWWPRVEEVEDVPSVQD
jgi:hypothetical protein